MDRRFYLRFGKRGFDLALASFGLLLLAVPLLALAAWIRIVEGGPVLFRQERVGRKGMLFRIYKFRTMDECAAAGGSVTVAGDPHVTRTGRWLRRLKVDELPQLLNVLKGEMSFVGPRPDVPGYMDRLQGEAASLLTLRPGITGPASLAFRDEETLLATVENPKAFNDHFIFPEKVRLNLQYLQEVSLKTDLLCLVRTLLPARWSPAPLRAPSAASKPNTTGFVVSRSAWVSSVGEKFRG